MKILLIILWLPYLLLLGHLFNRPSKRIYACVILIFVGIGRFKFPIYGSYDMYLFHAGILWCIMIIIFNLIINKKINWKVDRSLWKSVFWFYVILVFSLTFGGFEYPRFYSYTKESGNKLITCPFFTDCKRICEEICDNITLFMDF